MQRGKRAAYNSLANVLLQLVSLVCGFILPRLILSRFGSSYNGVISAVTQFLSIISLLRAGVVGATTAALYKPLAEGDIEKTSAIVRATEKFMRKVALIFVGFIVAFSCLYPLLVQGEFEWLFTATLVLIISISTFVQYFYGITYQMLLQADQRNYVHTLIEITSVILNTVLAAVLIQLGLGIHAVKLGSAVAFSLSPIFLNIYTKRHYGLIRNIKPDFSAISQRWDAFWLQVATFVHDNTDITLLSLFSNTREISVYTVYYLVGHGLRKIVGTISNSIDAAFGSMLARNETDVLNHNLDLYELMIHLLSTVLYGAALVLITPFVKVYTAGVTDVNYIRYAFGGLVVVSELLYSLRGPFASLIYAAGHFKQTKRYSFIETILNLGISLCLVGKFGVEGLVMGTTFSTMYLYLSYALYASKNIAHRSIWKFVKRLGVTMLCIAGSALLCALIPAGEMNGYLAWIIRAVQCGVVVLTITVVINMALYPRLMKALFCKLKSIAGSLLNR